MLKHNWDSLQTAQGHTPHVCQQSSPDTCIYSQILCSLIRNVSLQFKLHNFFSSLYKHTYI